MEREPSTMQENRCYGMVSHHAWAVTVMPLPIGVSFAAIHRQEFLSRSIRAQSSSIRLYGWQFASYQRMGRMLPALEGIEPMGIVPNVFTRLPVS